MAKPRTPKDKQEKDFQDKIRKRLTGLFSGGEELPTYMSISQVDALKAHVAELEAELAQRQPQVEMKIPSMALGSDSGAMPSRPVNANSADNDERRNANAFRITLIGIPASILAASLYLYLAVQNGAWQLYAWSIDIWVLALAAMIGMVLVRRKRTSLGVWVLLAAIQVTFIGAVALIQGLGLLLGISIAILVTIIAGQTLSAKMSNRATVLGVASGVAAVLLDMFGPAYRFPEPDPVRIFLPGILIVVIILFGIVTARQFSNYSLRTKLLVAFVIISVGSVGSIAFAVDSSQRTNRTNDIGENLSLLANAKALEVGQNVEYEFNLLNTLALTRAVQDRAELATQYDTFSQLEINQLDQQWQAADKANNNADPLVGGVLHDSLSSELLKFQAFNPEHTEIFLTDLKGVSVATTGRTSDYLQSDEEWWQKAYKDGLYIGQPEYDVSSKTIAIIMAVPVRSKWGNQIVGILRTTVNINSLGNVLITGRIGKTGSTDIYLPSGQDIDLITTGDGKYELTVAKADFDLGALSDLSKKYLELSENGIPNLVSVTGVSVPVDSHLYKTINGLGWRVVVLQEKAEALQPVETQTRNNLLLAILVTILAAIAALGMAQVLSGPLVRLNEVAGKVASGDLTVAARVESGDETGALAMTFNNMISQLRGLVGTLESRVADRTHDLELAAEVGRAVSEKSVDINGLLSKAVELIGERFNLYYTQIYLTDTTGRNLILRAGTGEVGSQLLSRAHNLPIAAGSINGRAAAEKRSVIVADTKQSLDFKPNPLLPDTRCEMATPLIAGGLVVGVLDMQSDRPGTLSETNLPAFEALAGQLAIAIQNAALFTETERARSEVEAQVSRLTEHGWQDFLDAIEHGERMGFAFDQSNIVRLEGENISTAPEAGFSVPISVTGTKIGEIQLAQEPDRSWTINDTELIEGAATQLAQHLENLRLLAQAEKYRTEAEDALRRLTREGWDTYLQTNSGETAGFIYNLNEVQSLKDSGNGEHNLAMVQSLKVQDEIVGELSVNAEADSQENANELVSAVAKQLSAHIENLRLSISNMSLLKSTEERAQREQTLRQITTALRSSTNPATIMRTAVRELGGILGRKTIVQLLNPEQVSQANSAVSSENESDSPAKKS